MAMSRKGTTPYRPADILKSPYVLEFAGLDDKSGYHESDLESAVLNKMQDFLLEMGKGFLFEKRQRRFTFNDKNFYCDMVLYNRFLRCYVLIDFKVDELTHQDLGQMQMYVNYYDRYEIVEGENPTIGILMCKQSDEALVELVTICIVYFSTKHFIPFGFEVRHYVFSLVCYPTMAMRMLSAIR